MVLRLEDLDPDRCTQAWCDQVMRDLEWLGLDWDNEPVYQSRRTPAYEAAFRQLEEKRLVYPCFCTRAERMAASAPHRSDGQAVYDGRCRRLTAEQREDLARQRNPAWRLAVPDRAGSFRDLLQGMYEENLLRDCGDFILRRSDGVYAYQLAVVVDDAWMGVTQVVRGSDLLSSTPRQRYLLELLGCPAPEYGHVPLLLAPDGRRLAKRDRDQELGSPSAAVYRPGAGGPAGPSGGADPGGGPCIPGRAGTPVRLGEAAPAGYRHGALVKEAAVSFRDRRRALCLQQEEADKANPMRPMRPIRT